MLLVPMFHKIGTGRYSNPPEFFDTLFKSLPTGIFPGEPIERRSYCFTFDDATKDFYDVGFPLLKKYNQKALLAVPTGLIDTPGYCTWKQLIEMEKTGLVQCASHTVSHLKLTKPSPEILQSKEILSTRLEREINSFVYPYGAFTKKVHAEVIEHYHYAFRIGSSINFSWKSPIYRLPADNLPSPEIHLSLKAFLNYFIHTLRGR